jgi:hypothetical protein
MSAFPPDDRTRGTERPIGNDSLHETADPSGPTPMRERSRRAGAAIIAILVLAALAVVLVVLL